ncbi:hypothetical protein Tco_1323621 [Tanacetum coccineum]
MMMILENLVLRGCVSCIVDELLVEGAAWSMEVDEGELVGSASHGAAATETEESLSGGLKYSSNIGWNNISQSFLVGGTYNVVERGVCTSPELIVLGVIS